MNLKRLYTQPGKTVVTAHRGFSGSHPENTLTAFTKAVEAGVDIVEFDVRETRDGRLVILHDATLDRTTDGSGPAEEKTGAELKALNASFWAGPHDTGRRLERPAGAERIPFLEEALSALAGRVGLNIQVYTASREALAKLVALYRAHGLEESAFLMLGSFEQAVWVRALDPRVAVCVGERRDDLERHLAFGVDFMQPRKHQLTDDYLRRLRAEGVPFNVFYANTPADIVSLLERGVRGIMTDAPDVLFATLRSHRGDRRE